MLFFISKSTSLLKQGFHGDEVEESNDFDLKKKKKKKIQRKSELYPFIFLNANGIIINSNFLLREFSNMHWIVISESTWKVCVLINFQF